MANIEINKIEYLSIQILKTEITNLSKNPLVKGDDFKVDYEFKAIDLYNLPEQLIRVIINANIVAMKDGNPLDAGAKFEIDSYFRYPDLKDVVRLENDRMLVDTGFAGIVKGLAYSTSRGVIFCKLSGTFLEGVVLPVKESTDLKAK